MFETCQHCNRVLTSLESKRLGFGPECRESLAAQQHVIDAARAAINTRATDDSTLIVLGRILARHENNLLRFGEDEVVPKVIVHALRKVRRDFSARARYLHRMGWLYIPEQEYRVAA